MPLTPIGEICARLAADDPDRPAIVCGETTRSRAELELVSNRLARAYGELGVRAGDLVTVALPNGVEFYESCLAIWKLGATPQPVSWRLPERERQQIIELARPRLVVGTDGQDVAAHVPAGFEPESSLPDGPLPTRVSPSWKAMTSGGSTGRPKLIVSADPGAFDLDRRPLEMQPHQVHLVSGPLYHNAPFLSFYGLFLGQQLVVLERFDAQQALSAIGKYRVGYAQFVPTMLHRMWRIVEPDPSRYDLTSLEIVWHLAAPCPAWLKRVWIDLLGPERLWELYGATEGQAATYIRGDEWLEHPGSVGRPGRGEIKVFDPEGNEVAPGQIGELFLRPDEGATATYRYIGAEARRLPGGWESVGDIGWIDRDGYVYLSDRRTDLILSGGANVYPAEVEGAILEHPQVLSCVVVGLPDEDLGQSVHAVVQCDQPVEEDDLRRFVSERLVRYKNPRTYRFVGTSLRDDAGKVRRGAVREEEVRIRDGIADGA